MVMTQNQVILKFMESLANTDKTGIAALNEAVQQLGYSSFKALRQSFFNTIKPYKAVSKAKEKEFLETYCGIKFSNTDTGAITGSDAGGAVTKTAVSIVPETSAVSDLEESEYASFECNGLTVNVTYATAQYGFSSDQQTLEAKERLIVKNLYNWWGKEALDLIEESYGINFSDGRASVTELEVKFVAPNSSYKNCDPVKLTVNTADGFASSLVMTIDMNYFVSLSDTDNNGTITRYGEIEYLDRDLLDAFTEAALAANVKGFSSFDHSFKLGLIRLVGGGDYIYNPYFGVECSAGGTDGNSWEQNGFSAFEAYAVLRYLARQVSDKSLPAGLTVSRDGQTLTASAALQERNFATSDYSENVKTIDARKVNRSITLKGNTKANVIRAGAGGGNYYGMGGNDSLYGGVGTDTFYYAAGDGKDTIYDFGTDKDKIRLVSGETLIQSTMSGDNVLLTLGSGSITVNKGVGKLINVKEDGKDTQVFLLPNGVTANSNRTTLTVKAPFAGTLDIAEYTSTIRTIDASNSSYDLTIKGNAYNNTIKAGKVGGDCYGQKGNDTLYGGAGEDVFWYGAGDGADTINKFQSGKDILRLYNKASISSVATSGTNVTLRFGSGSVKLAGLANKRTDIIDAAGKRAIYYFGRQDKANTFVYGANYRYHGGIKYKDTLQINKGATVSLANTTLYHNLDILDARKAASTVKLTGGKKAATLYGGKKNDTLTAGSAGDILRGGAGNDTIVCGKGVDKIQFYKGDGKDIIKSGAKNDILYLYNINNINSQAKFKMSGKNLVMSFTTNKNDTITLTNWTTNGLNKFVVGSKTYSLKKSGGKVTVK